MLRKINEKNEKEKEEAYYMKKDRETSKEGYNKASSDGTRR